ncbi:DNA integrity scanning protein DisA nucleotide-binding domain protein [Methanocaldococcus indicus]|uniref:DNA integrity scanning protein DisA nucleotide-binding domain protein n=1 Tax=Methanocaldococcus indicus TaxID=213231 RepID=UPI003C6D90D7
MIEHVLRHGIELAYDIKADGVMLFTETGMSYELLLKYLDNKPKKKLKLPIIEKIFNNSFKIIVATSNENLYKKVLKESSNIIPLYIKYSEDTKHLIISAGILKALEKKIIKSDSILVAILGKPKVEGRLDTITVVFVKEYIDNIKLYEFFNLLNEKLKKTVKEVLKLAIELGREGREGKKVGTIFIIGDSLNVMSKSKPLILNPFAGHKASIFDDNVKGTVKELSSIDGAFIITDDGKVISAGRFLESKGNVSIPQGLGARHVAAASITKETDAIAITVSESGGVVRIFKDGKIVAEIDPIDRIFILEDEE